MFIVFDLDGTLALNEHRRRFVEGFGKKDWDSFFKLCGGDTLNRPVATILHTMRQEGHRVEIWSGRSNDAITLTRGWLYMHGLHHIPYKGRPHNCFSSDVHLKRSWLHEDKAYWPDLMFDDRDSVVKMWRNLGIPCFQVAEGDF